MSMKVIVTFSGGKDSLAALLWTREHITKNFTTVFCDTGWEHPLTYEYINRIADKLHLDLVTLKSKKYDGMVDLARQKKRWPSTRARFCTQELKTKPCIDYVLDEVQYADDSGHPGSRIGQPGQDAGAMYVLQVLF